jgi:hypothetical protein
VTVRRPSPRAASDRARFAHDQYVGLITGVSLARRALIAERSETRPVVADR